MKSRIMEILDKHFGNEVLNSAKIIGKETNVSEGKYYAFTMMMLEQFFKEGKIIIKPEGGAK